MQTLDFIGVDWGTSNVRAWGMSRDGAVLFARASDRGMGRLQPREFAPVLLEMLPEIRATRAPDVLICGMAGARQGWVEAPYLEAPVELTSLLGSAIPVQAPRSDSAIRILPGICQRGGRDDVMRGEETQLLGVSVLRRGFSGLICMPGTHTKWARLCGTRLEGFTTSMTGEIYEVLRVHSILRHSVDAEDNSALRDEGFEKGGEIGLDHPERLLDELFRIRAGALLSGRPPEWSLGYLSGLLIGTEIGARRPDVDGGEVLLIGAAPLCALYATLMAKAGIGSRLIPSDEAVRAGFQAARTS